MHRVGWERTSVTTLNQNRQSNRKWRHSFGKQPGDPGCVATFGLWATQLTSWPSLRGTSLSREPVWLRLVLSLLRAILCGPRELYKHKNPKPSQWATQQRQVSGFWVRQHFSTPTKKDEEVPHPNHSIRTALKSHILSIKWGKFALYCMYFFFLYCRLFTLY